VLAHGLCEPGRPRDTLHAAGDVGRAVQGDCRWPGPPPMLKVVVVAEVRAREERRVLRGGGCTFASTARFPQSRPAR
jgi:hypothetical protein